MIGDDLLMFSTWADGKRPTCETIVRPVESDDGDDAKIFILCNTRLEITFWILISD